MKNGRRNNDNDSKRRTSGSSSTSRQSIADGSDIRPNDGNESSISREGESVGIKDRSIDDDNSKSSRGNANVTLADGFYFTPSGTVERIPDGHYIHTDGRLRKRRQSKRDGGNSADGNENRDRTETGEQQEYDSEIPIRSVGKKRQKKVTEHQQRLTMVAMLSIATSAIFTSVALLTKHKHWELVSDEARILAESLNEAFATLPTKAYEQIIAIIEKWVPWVNLVFVVSAIIIPRIEESVKRVEETHYRENPVSNKRDDGTKDNPFANYSSLGFDER
jgi:hypothetical protein